MAFDDPAVVREQYAAEDNLRARKALWEGAVGVDAKDVLWKALEAWQPRNVLEVGGGEGELAERIQRELGAKVSFVDLSPRMVELARARGLEAQEGDAQDLPFSSETFDTVVAAWMLYHVPNLDAALGEFVRVLRPGGALIAVTGSVHHLAELRELLAYPPGAFELSFNAENGEEILERHFASIERFDCEVKAIVEDRETLVAYRNSTSVPAGEVPEDVELPFIVHGRTSIFVATT